MTSSGRAGQTDNNEWGQADRPIMSVRWQQQMGWQADNEWTGRMVGQQVGEWMVMSRQATLRKEEDPIRKEGRECAAGGWATMCKE